MNLYEDITKFIFVSDQPQDSDIIFIPGGSYPEIAEKAAQVFQQVKIHFILPSGKYSIKRGYFPGVLSKADVYNEPYKTEWDFLKNVLMKNGVPEAAILKEDEATNTYENTLLSRKVTDARGLSIEKAIICCKSFHARRCLMYYQLAYPETSFLVCPTDTQGISRDNWFRTPEGIKRVLGELERCGGQFVNLLKPHKTA
ncbi:MAG: YdcF family protein [Clostridia bacterium]|nr:YdcF family protein [Clostridia bacterium]